MILLISNSAYSQTENTDSVRVDTSDVNFEAPVEYNAEDSMIFSIPMQQVYLYGKAHVTYGEIALDADYIEFNFSTKIALAKYTVDSVGKVIGKPIFRESGDEYVMDSIRYNFDTRKGTTGPKIG